MTYTDRLTIEMGDRYDDVFGPPPASLFSRYGRVCSRPDGGGRTVEVFVHSHGDLEADVASLRG